MVKKDNKKYIIIISIMYVVIVALVLLLIDKNNSENKKIDSDYNDIDSSVDDYISNSKADTYIDNVQVYARAARSALLIGDIDFPISHNDAVVMSFSFLNDYLEGGGISAYDSTQSWILVINSGTANNPKNEYYIAACDNNGHGIGKNKEPMVVEYDDLKKNNIIDLGKKNGKCNGLSIPDISPNFQKIAGLDEEVIIVNSIKN